MSSHPFQTLKLDQLSLLFTPCPGTKEQSLQDSLQTLKAAGAEVLITMMPSEEMVKNEVTALPELCAALGIEWFHFPVEDDCAPDQECQLKWANEKAAVVAAAKANKTIAVHCKGGTGRTGLMISLILAELGLGYDEIVERVQAVKEKSLTLPPHVKYLKQYLA
ncbi:tyrosine-protein phosphatase [Neiella marina]|uniref:Tyrosine-protein phosphatase n=1 Tax=Neiella holothuriorum TaxID=2870530 RepID=A0ABS7EIQ3_9GAMM|nr:tyrosine-protein phosphatase [Neiella holothuriorum]MBW8192165.1 tyrosine-protein phosphatase [Neiella holothuriorum]